MIANVMNSIARYISPENIGNVLIYFIVIHNEFSTNLSTLIQYLKNYDMFHINQLIKTCSQQIIINLQIELLNVFVYFALEITFRYWGEHHLILRCMFPICLTSSIH